MPAQPLRHDARPHAARGGRPDGSGCAHAEPGSAVRTVRAPQRARQHARLSGADRPVSAPARAAGLDRATGAAAGTAGAAGGAGPGDRVARRFRTRSVARPAGIDRRAGACRRGRCLRADAARSRRALTGCAGVGGGWTVRLVLEGAVAAGRTLADAARAVARTLRARFAALSDAAHGTGRAASHAGRAGAGSVRAGPGSTARLCHRTDIAGIGYRQPAGHATDHRSGSGPPGLAGRRAVAWFPAGIADRDL